VNPPADANGATTPVNLPNFIDRNTVLVAVIDRDGVTWGSGFFVNDKNVVTNYHVVESVVQSGEKAQVYSPQWGKLVPARVVADSNGTEPLDFAVLEIPEATGQLPAKLGFKANRMEQVTAAGFPGYIAKPDATFQRLLDGEQTTDLVPYTLGGFIAGFPVNARMEGPVLLTTAEIGHGSSGGPLYDNCGWIVGVNTFLNRPSNPAEGDLPDPIGRYAQTAPRLGDFLKSKNIPFDSEDRDCTPIVAGATPALPSSSLPPVQQEGQPAPPQGQQTPSSPAPPAPSKKKKDH
jgi:S1-C subfamily serine protease